MSMGGGSARAWKEACERAEGKMAAMKRRHAREQMRLVRTMSRLVFEVIEDEAITRQELKRAAGILQNDHPDLAQKLLRLVTGIENGLKVGA